MNGYTERTAPSDKKRCTWEIEQPAYKNSRRCTRPRKAGSKLCKTHLKVTKCAARPEK